MLLAGRGRNLQPRLTDASRKLLWRQHSMRLGPGFHGFQGFQVAYGRSTCVWDSAEVCAVC